MGTLVCISLGNFDSPKCWALPVCLFQIIDLCSKSLEGAELNGVLRWRMNVDKVRDVAGLNWGSGSKQPFRHLLDLLP